MATYGIHAIHILALQREIFIVKTSRISGFQTKETPPSSGRSSYRAAFCPNRCNSILADTYIDIHAFLR